MCTDPETILKRLAHKDAKALELLPVYQSEDYRTAWVADPRLYRAFAKKLISQGQPARGFELAREGLAAFPGDQYLLYARAQAMTRGGNISGAEKHLAELLKLDIEPPRLRIDAVSLQGRLWKMRFLRERDPARQKKHLAESLKWYHQAAALPGADTFPLINVATLTLLNGEIAEAHELARQVIGALAEGPPPAADDYWHLATLGEAHLLLADLQQATEWYARAVALARAQNAEGDITSMRLNALLIKDKRQLPEDVLRLFFIGSVVVFAGHMIDHPGRGASQRAAPRFPADPQLIGAVSKAIDVQLEELNAAIGICGAACGGDILFAERMLARENCELHVVLPYDLRDFYKTSVDFGLGEPMWQEWRARCDAVLKRATKVEVHYATSESYLGDDVLHELNTEFMQGLAILRAGQRGIDPQALVLRDPAAAPATGGTAHFLARWEARGLTSREIDLAKLREEIVPSSRRPAPAAPPALLQPRPTARQLKAMLFADVKGFSTLSDPHLFDFFESYLGEVRKVLRSLTLGRQPDENNTWGDGLYLVFDTVGACAEAALRLVELGERIEWAKFKLGPEVPLRVGVHTGPVFHGRCPIREVESFFGSQVTRAARIEPVTVPGCAFASEQFAALLAVEEGDRYVCEPIGVEQLAKEYGKCALYRLGRR